MVFIITSNADHTVFII